MFKNITDPTDNLIFPVTENTDAMIRVLMILAELTGWQDPGGYSRNWIAQLKMSITYGDNPFEVYRNQCSNMLRHFKKLKSSRALPEAMLEMTETGGTETFLYWCVWFQERNETHELRFFCRFVLTNSKTNGL